ncbi:spore coat protein CotJB [Limnochorda pilosa]|uniref:Protein CotJB domain-containing protein n=1 Tax=Limnochorda pilosa TaxID=1555112 RepID=A0A0K2SML3_LIMPI|nr:spore coat protein CotJB [Limnochorda pilosa]BAS28368.1 hypothetical protein LIP_2538 [Limnochorda pilosa]
MSRQVPFQPGEEELMLELQTEEFQAVDWMLFADTHEEGMEEYRRHAARTRELMETYVSRYGPLIWMDPEWAGPDRGVPWA